MTSGTRVLGPLAVVLALALGCVGDEVDPGGGIDGGKADVWGEGGAEAPAWLLSVEGLGTWRDEADEEAGHDVLRAWVDARVANTRYDKRVFVEVLAPYEGGAFLRALFPAVYRGGLGTDERWGVDDIEIYPTGGPNGAALAGPVAVRLRLQHDVDGDGGDEMAMTPWTTLHGSGELVLPATDPWAPGVSSPVLSDVASPQEPDVYFAPFEDPGRRVVEEIDRVIEAQRRAPHDRHTIHAAVFNITDDEIVDHLIAAHEAGVEVRLVFDGRKFRPWYDWYRGDDRLLAAGVPLLGVVRADTGAMHDKIALFDGRLVATGSFNWEPGARWENHENMIVSAERDVVAAYAQRFEALAGSVLQPRRWAADPAARVAVSFGPDEEPFRAVGRLIDQAQETLYLAMFTAKDVEYEEDGRRTSLLQKLVDAHDRGVEVIVVVDQGIHEASEYHGVLSEDDQHDEWLEDRGVHVVRADNRFGAYASMHHKFLVIDGEILVTGAFNWYYDAAYRNDEDQIVWRDRAVAEVYTGEFIDLLHRYDPAFEPAAWPQVEVGVAARHDGTAWGDRVLLVGDLPEAGAWDPAGGVELSPEDWPIWRGALTMTAGVRLAYKLVVRHADGSVTWESGDDRLFQPQVGAGTRKIEIEFRR